MLMLAADAPAGSQRYARFQNREEVGIITFSGQPAATRLFPMGATAEENAKARASVAQFIQPMVTDGSTAIYASVEQALEELGRERDQNKDKRYYTIVLMTDGENNRSPNESQFREWYRAEGASVRGIPVFPILFGEGDAKALRELADLTGGRLFDSRSTNLASVFKEIRGYQ
jgi:Ca-activated chloride channel family protein